MFMVSKSNKEYYAKALVGKGFKMTEKNDVL